MPSDAVHRTAITRLKLTSKQREKLEQLLDEWRRGCQLAVDAGWNVTYQPQQLQSLAYDRIRSETELGSQHAILASRYAARAIKGCVQAFAEGRRASKPAFTAPTIAFDARTMTLFDDGTISLTTTGRRVRCGIVLPSDPAGYQYKFLDDEAWRLSESTLTFRGGDAFVHLTFKRYRPVSPQQTAEDGTVLGVDLGIDNLAVTSTAAFFSGGTLRHRQEQFEQIRARLDRRGSRSARRTLKRLGDREYRFAIDTLHRVANGIVEEAVAYDCSVIVLEELTGISMNVRNRPRLHQWAHRRLRTFVEYKAADLGIHVAAIDPAYTSQQCSDCGHVGKSNRPSRTSFRCEQCGSSANADYNAAKNIGLKYVRRGRQLSRRTGASRCALKSGTVTPEGAFSPYDTE